MLYHTIFYVMSCCKQALSSSFGETNPESPVSLNFCNLSLFFVNDP